MLPSLWYDVAVTQMGNIALNMLGKWPYWESLTNGIDT